MSKRKLDPYTLRHIATRVDRRAELLRSSAERRGWRQAHHFYHRAAELESVAMRLRGEATMALESATRKNAAK